MGLITSKNLGDVLNVGVGAATSLIGMAYGANQSRLAFERQQWLQQREFELNEQAAKSAYERELQADATKYQRQVQDLQAAGLNPMLAVGQSAGSVHSAAGSTSTGSGPMASTPNLGGVLQALEFNMRRREVDADVKLKEAQANNLNERTTGQEIQNWIQDHTKELQVESAKLENMLKEKKIELTQEDINKAKEQTKLIVEQQKTEAAKQGALLAETVLKNAQASQIVQLLPYQKALMEAQTENQKAAAALAWAHEAYQRGLIEHGYLDSFCREAFASANQAESEAAISGVKAAIQSGDYSHSAMGYVPVISECATGLSNAFGVIGNVFHGLLK